MVIELATVGETLKPIEIELGPDELKFDVAGAEQSGNVRFVGDVRREDVRVRIRGNIRAAFDVDCARCLEPVKLDLNIPVDAAYVPADEEPVEAELELAGGDLNESIAENGVIDVTEMVREQILLELPDQPLCQEDCKGLCAKCGANRNLISCNCDEDELDPRWSALKDLM